MTGYTDNAYNVSDSFSKETVKAFLSVCVQALHEMDHLTQGKVDCSLAFLHALEKGIQANPESIENYYLENPGAGQNLSDMLSIFQNLMNSSQGEK